MHAGVQLDLFLAQPDNWSLTLLVRTGVPRRHGAARALEAAARPRARPAWKAPADGP
jgi:hypothetical protein